MTKTYKLQREKFKALMIEKKALLRNKAGSYLHYPTFRRKNGL